MSSREFTEKLTLFSYGNPRITGHVVTDVTTGEKYYSVRVDLDSGETAVAKFNDQSNQVNECQRLMQGKCLSTVH